MNMYEDIDYSQIDKILDSILGTSRSFGDYVGEYIKGEGLTYDGIYDSIAGVLSGELGDIKSLIGNMLLIILVAAVFINLSKAFDSRQTSENGFYITYMLMFILLSVSFNSLYELAKTTMENLVDFMKALLPTFFMTVTYVTGGASLVFYQSALTVIGLVEYILYSIFMPIISVYFVFSVISPIMSEGFCSKLLELVEKIVNYGLKGLLGIVTGISVIQGMIVPVSANVRKGIFSKIIRSIPAAGNAVDTVIDSVYGAGLLIKNAVGVAGLVIVILICAVPVVKIAVYSLAYHAGAALCEPIAGDNRMIECISRASQATILLLKTVLVAAVLFLITIGIVVASIGIA